MNLLWLASGSPRRRDLLVWTGFHVEVHPSHVDEGRVEGHGAIEHARDVARRKGALAPLDRVVLSADTVVHIGDDILEKPDDFEHACAHLRALSGRWHQVTTGVYLRGNGGERLLHKTTDVRFRTLDDREIVAYVSTGEPMDKAGAYGIQGRGGTFVAEVRGSWTNVMGLPVEATMAALAELGVTPWT